MLRRIEAKKERRKKFWMGALLAFLMVFSMLGILVGSRGGEKWEYNGFKFTRAENAFVTKIDDKRIGFNYLPQSLLDINVSANIKAKLSAPMIYLTFNPDNDIQDLLYIDTIRNDLQRSLNTIVIDSITKESDTYFLPVISCDNATEYVPVIYFSVSNQTSIVDDNGCVVLSGKGADFFRLRDLVLYYYYGVMNG
ncbi:hypothetical protein HQ533_02605 [Candidatus Woesearchaeota archaeon]|nr:hypothetical protein [Candidatus Woesearchaeota archaeon]